MDNYQSHGTFEDENNMHGHIASLCSKSIVEIGVFEGNTSLIFLRYNPLITVYGIDPIIPDSMDPSLIGDFQKIEEISKRYPRYVFIREFSYNVVKNWSESISYLFIDGDHHYEMVKKDFEDWLPFVDFNGYISLHDSALNRGGNCWPGPSQLSDELLKDERLEYVDTVGSLTIFKKCK